MEKLEKLGAPWLAYPEGSSKARQLEMHYKDTLIEYIQTRINASKCPIAAPQSLDWRQELRKVNQEREELRQRCS